MAEHACEKESDRVPGSVLTNVGGAVRWLQEIRGRVDATVKSLDVGLGGNGRYEADALVNSARDVSTAMETVMEFRRMAPSNGVDAERVLMELGGVPSFEPSEKAKSWMPEKAESAG